MNYLIPVVIGAASIAAGYLIQTNPKTDSKQEETKPKWILSITKIYDSLVKVEVNLPGKQNSVPYKLQLFSKNNKKLLEVFNTNILLLSSNDKSKLKEEIYAVIQDHHGFECKTKLYSLEIEKNISLSSRILSHKDTFVSLLKKQKSFKFLTCGGCGQGKSSLLKAIFDLFESLGFVLKEGNREMIKCYKAAGSVTNEIFNLKLEKEIDGELVKIEIIDCPGFWNQSSTNMDLETPKTIISRILEGNVPSGIDIDMDKREFLYPSKPVSNPISRPDVILYCVKHELITSAKQPKELFQALKEHSWKSNNIPTVLVATALDAGITILNEDRDLKDFKSFVFNNEESVGFEEIDQREMDLLFSNYSKPITSLEGMDTSLVPILNYCENNLAFIDQVPSRRELSDFLLYQLLIHTIKSKRFAV